MKFNVVFATSFEIEAEDEQEAIDKAQLIFNQELKYGEDIFGVNAEEVI